MIRTIRINWVGYSTQALALLLSISSNSYLNKNYGYCILILFPTFTSMIIAEAWPYFEGLYFVAVYNA